MKRIILSEEEKKRIEDKANQFLRDRAYQQIRRSKRICPRCSTVFDRRLARKNHHTGYCSVSCNPGGIPIPRKTKSERKAARKAKELRKKQEKLRLNRYRKQTSAEFYFSKEWRELRFKVLRRYGAKCMLCGTGTEKGPVHVDHIKPRSKYPELELSFDNLQILCVDCNLGKSNLFDDDFRPQDEVDFLTDAARAYKP